MLITEPLAVLDLVFLLVFVDVQAVSSLVFLSVLPVLILFQQLRSDGSFIMEMD